VYAIVRTGGKQYRAEQGSVLKVEKVAGRVGDKVTLSDVLLVSSESGVSVGNPVSGASVTGTIVAQDRDAKVRVFKYKKRKHYQRARGHRQTVTTVRVDAILA
jgi:large subunit ribosomal protein L21